jgi:hypothetical protein
MHVGVSVLFHGLHFMIYHIRWHCVHYRRAMSLLLGGIGNMTVTLYHTKFADAMRICTLGSSACVGFMYLFLFGIAVFNAWNILSFYLY